MRPEPTLADFFPFSS